MTDEQIAEWIRKSGFSLYNAWFNELRRFAELAYQAGKESKDD